MKLVIALLLAIIHGLTGFVILLVATWFIAASSIASLGFNYMLPAVLIRGLALLRIASGYAGMLLGHDHLLTMLAKIRLKLFAQLQDKTTLSRLHSLDVLERKSEELASIWVAWVGQNAGILLSLITANFACAFLTPELSDVLLGFSAVFGVLYVFLFYKLSHLTRQLAREKRRQHFAFTKHIEAASVWHLYADYTDNAPTLNGSRRWQRKINDQQRFYSLSLSLAMIGFISILFTLYADTFAGQATYIILPTILLSAHDWLGPALTSQVHLHRYISASKDIEEMDSIIQDHSLITSKLAAVRIENFKPAATAAKEQTLTFETNTLSLLTGSSGVGKSRFLQSLAGLHPYSGRRGEAGTGLLTDALYIEQFPYVLSDTMRENLKISAPHASEQDIIAALDAVGLYKLRNLDEWVGENGRVLSGGERKRLGIARALLTGKSLLLIDEPFESLDEVNIERICKALNNLTTTKTLIIASHIAPKSLAIDTNISLESSLNTAVTDVSKCSGNN